MSLTEINIHVDTGICHTLHVYVYVSSLSYQWQVKELITKKDPNLLDSFLDVSKNDVYWYVQFLYMMYIYLCIVLQEVMAFMQDPSADVRKFVVGFMEDAW